MKVLTGVKALLAAAFAAAGLVAFAEPEVEITKAWQANPGSGTIDLTYEVRNVGRLPCDLTFRVEAKGCETTYTFTNKHVAAGVVTTNIDYKAMLGGIYPNVSVYLSAAEKSMEMESVQLWENGPYFATCNVGATKPEEYGYYFWWGDTVGYVYNEDEHRYDASDGSVVGYDFSDANCPTSGKTVDDLKAEGWCDDSGILKPEHDAATVQWGGQWRMPKQEEYEALAANCNHEWVNNWNGTGINGMLITGKGAYSDKSIFFPGAGIVTNPTEAPYAITLYSDLYTSTPNTSIWGENPLITAGRLHVGVTSFGYYSDCYRKGGCSIRPVRDAK